ncbi:prepilin-type N-terminal cleavage/methylation domain-containing protein [Cellulomonas rhizosphaerae]|uniref:Prepilin-type N-terminal cleavage/methylation domain-containing protein n=1 Tax=Cellulomonas rhizosphaerae TaxID=2293719 RepID=A0A413RLF6_9CELL|nr:prepilin-type N-terminal cleavage/methylation domain-containing protein [Cellulomonas rhizosphaerae]RHA40534.1 prepilin-type N-terminal cleavage/methylation domain-containing protein [Cellulomonas rhizosphaerae]
MRALRRRTSAEDGRGRDRGTTLAELLIGMTIFSVLLAAVATMAVGYYRVNAQSVARQDQVDETRAAAERFTKLVRTVVKPSQLINCVTATCSDIDAFVSASATSMKFYANIDNAGNLVGPRQVTYTLEPTGTGTAKLVERVQRPDSSTPGNNGYSYCDALASGASGACKSRLTTKVLVEGVRTDGAVRPFVYFDNAGKAMTPASGTALSPAQIDQVLSIEFTLRVRSADQNSTGATTYIQRILLPNSQAVLRPGEDA